MLLSKWPSFYSVFLVWVHTFECRPVQLSWGGGGVVLRAQSALRKTVERGIFEWLRLRRCVRNDLGVRYLLRQAQSQIPLPVRIPGLQGTWYPSYEDRPGVRPRNCYCNPTINPNFNVWSGFFHFRVHELTQIGKYDLVFLTHNPINEDDKRRIFFRWLWKCCPCFSFLIFPIW